MKMWHMIFIEIIWLIFPNFFLCVDLINVISVFMDEGKVWLKVESLAFSGKWRFWIFLHLSERKIDCYVMLAVRWTSAARLCPNAESKRQCGTCPFNTDILNNAFGGVMPDFGGCGSPRQLALRSGQFFSLFGQILELISNLSLDSSMALKFLTSFTLKLAELWDLA